LHQVLQITVNQEWSDARTELFKNNEEREACEWLNPHQRRCKEFDSTRVFTDTKTDHFVTKKDIPSLLTDNSQKVCRGDEDELRPTSGDMQAVHQGHLRSSLMANEFYDVARACKEWEVAEVHLGGLPRDADEKYLRDLIHSKGGQIVSVKLELDPVLHTCKGRAKLVMRYNPAHYDINALIRELESHNLVVFF